MLQRGPPPACLASHFRNTPPLHTFLPPLCPLGTCPGSEVKPRRKALGQRKSWTRPQSPGTSGLARTHTHKHAHAHTRADKSAHSVSIHPRTRVRTCAHTSSPHSRADPRGFREGGPKGGPVPPICLSSGGKFCGLPTKPPHNVLEKLFWSNGPVYFIFLFFFFLVFVSFPRPFMRQ